MPILTSRPRLYRLVTTPPWLAAVLPPHPTPYDPIPPPSYPARVCPVRSVSETSRPVHRAPQTYLNWMLGVSRHIRPWRGVHHVALVCGWIPSHFVRNTFIHEGRPRIPFRGRAGGRRVCVSRGLKRHLYLHMVVPIGFLIGFRPLSVP